MPVYSYECPECGLSVELTLPVEQRDDLVVCAEGHVLKRKFSAVPFTIEGKAYISKGWADRGDI